MPISRLPADVQGWSHLRRPIWLFDPVSCRGLYANAPALELWGAESLDELLQRDFSRLSPAVRSRTERLAAVTANGDIVSERWSFYPKGRPVTVQALISSMRLQDGSVALLFEATPVDVEEGELRAVEALRHTSSPIALFDGLGEVIFANPAAYAAYGEGRGFVDRFEDPAEGAAALADVTEGKVLAELRQVRTSGGERAHFIDARQVIDPVTGQTSVLLGERDVTAQLEAEWARDVAEERAEVAEAKQRFLANISHDLRTPLNSVIGFAGVLAASSLDAHQRSHLERITRAGETLLDTINDVIDLAELDGGKVHLDPAPFDPAALLCEALAAVEPTAVAKGLELRLDLPTHSLPLAVGDAKRLRTVISHYLVNAVKFTELGGVVVSLAASPTDADGVELEVSVADTGPGIEEAAQARLFRRFGQGDDSASRRTVGAGLGLAVSKALMNLMGGEVGVESSPGRGSRFWLRVGLPIHHEDAAQEHDPTGEGRPLTILYADDNESNRTLVKALLESQGCCCETVNDGAEAVSAARDFSYDLILMDIQMPVKDGVSATMAIRAERGAGACPPILAVTANTLAEQRRAYEAAGMVDCISKPLNTAELFTKVAYWADAATEPATESQTAFG